jgi:hypothetical protein
MKVRDLSENEFWPFERNQFSSFIPSLQASRPSKNPEYWDAYFFNLHHVKRFQRMSLEKQKKIIFGLNESILQEIFCIEYLGMNYASKMCLQAPSVSEKVLYGHLAQDEARHFMMISPYVKNRRYTANEQPFIGMIDGLIRECESYKPLVFFVQVLLEGWGLLHYRRLAESCGVPDLAENLRSIIKDEGRHHGSGVIQFCDSELNIAEENLVIQIAQQLLAMVQMGPSSVLAHIDEGSLSQSEKADVLFELQGPESAQANLNYLQDLILKACSAESHIYRTLSPQFQAISVNDAAGLL